VQAREELHGRHVTKFLEGVLLMGREGSGKSWSYSGKNLKCITFFRKREGGWPCGLWGWGEGKIGCCLRLVEVLV